MSIEKEFFDCLKLPLTPITLRRVFLLLLQSHLSNPDHYGDLKEQTGCLYYDRDNPAKSPLNVELGWIQDPKAETSYTNGVFVALGEIGFEKVALDNLAGEVEDGSGIHRVQIASTKLVVQHIMPSADQAYNLAIITSSFLSAIARMLIERVGLMRFDLQQISTPREVKKAPERFLSCDVTFDLSYPNKFTTKLEGHRIKTFAMSMKAAV
jgi:hypothetical protein